MSLFPAAFLKLFVPSPAAVFLVRRSCAWSSCSAAIPAKAPSYSRTPSVPRCDILTIVEILEILVVHVEEAVRLGTMDDGPHLRLGRNA